ncbi:MAG: hypothetical protein HKL90_11800 [Elusimicrobia bacterium]|nr:hypothetical protein [Elusimicrobiota bacterium]
MNNQTKGIEFEKHCMDFLQQLGFASLKQIRRSGDQGANMKACEHKNLTPNHCVERQATPFGWAVEATAAQPLRPTYIRG